MTRVTRRLAALCAQSYHCAVVGYGPRVGLALGFSFQVIPLTACNGSQCSAGAGGNRWNVSGKGPCAAPTPHCVLDPAATCSAVPSPVPECADASNICWQNAPAACAGGFVVNVGAACGGATCVHQGACVFCDNGNTSPDPACTNGATSTCVENSIFACTCAGRVGPPTAACGDGGLCREVSCGDASSCYAACL